MTTKVNSQISSAFLKRSLDNFWWNLAFLLLSVLIFHGKTVPFSNEFLYLLRLEPNFLPSDWTFSQPANEHWLFNALFSLPAYIFSLETVCWLGRIAVWSLCLSALLKIGRRWGIAYWTITVSIFLWLAFGQAVVNDEWIFGGFEAKTIAYICLLFALNKFSEQKITLPSILLGLSFSFHPAVGLWAIAAIGFIFLSEIKHFKTGKADFSSSHFNFSSFLIFCGLTILFALPGVLPLLAEQSNVDANSFETWRFIVKIREPWHLDPFQFSKSGIVLIYAMLAFNIFALWKSKNFALRFLLKFQIALGGFFLLGIFLRWFEVFSLLRFMPLRLFPIFTPLFFLFTAFYFIPQIAFKTQKILAALFVIMVILSLNPFGKGFQQVQSTFKTWRSAPDDLQRTSVWISHNTPDDAVIIQPPNRRDFWYFSRRAGVVSYIYPTYNRLNEWQGRIGDLTDNRQITNGEFANEEIEEAYNHLPAEQIAAIKNKYGAAYLVSRADYPYPIVFETKTYKVYQLN